MLMAFHAQLTLGAHIDVCWTKLSRVCFVKYENKIIWKTFTSCTYSICSIIFRQFSHAVSAANMSILKYFKRGGVLPNPNGHLSTSLSPRSIQECNTRVSEVLDKSPAAPSKKRGFNNTEIKYFKVLVLYLMFLNS